MGNAQGVGICKCRELKKGVFCLIVHCLTLSCFFVLEQIKFLNSEWDNPLREVLNDGSVVIHEAPEELAELDWADLKYICRIMTHSNILRKGGMTLCFPQLDGQVSMFESRHCLSTMDGLWSFLIKTKNAEPDVNRVIRAWNWLVEHNPYYQEAHFLPVTLHKEMVLSIQQDLPNGSGIASQRHLFSETVVQGLPPGLSAGDINPAELTLGIDRSSGESVRYGEPSVMGKMFPELFPYGRRAFKLSHHKTNLRGDNDQYGGVHTLKDYAKYRSDISIGRLPGIIAL